MSLRDKIVSAPPVFRRLTVDVPEWDCKLEARALTVEAKHHLGTLAAGDGGEVDVMAYLLTSSVFDPDTGEAVFTEADAEWIRQQDSELVERVAGAVLEVSGLTQRSLPKDDSSTSLSTATSSSSPGI